MDAGERGGFCERETTEGAGGFNPLKSQLKKEGLQARALNSASRLRDIMAKILFPRRLAGRDWGFRLAHDIPMPVEPNPIPTLEPAVLTARNRAAPRTDPPTSIGLLKFQHPVIF